MLTHVYSLFSKFFVVAKDKLVLIMTLHHKMVGDTIGKSPSSTFKARIDSFHVALNQEKVKITELANLVYHGCSYNANEAKGYGLRSLSWKLLLSYLPLRRSEWAAFREKHQRSYSAFVNELIVHPGSQAPPSDAPVDVTMDDHPLNPNPTSQWATFFKDNATLLQIDKDVRRLCPDLNFFQTATPHPCLILTKADATIMNLRQRVEQTSLEATNVIKSKAGINNMVDTRRRTSSLDYRHLKPGQEAHWEVVERILFLYAKLNPGQGYVQGMNEIIGPLYYTFATDPDEAWRASAESDTFYCFTNLMSEIRDFFIQSLDDSKTGIRQRLKGFMDLLQQYDEELWSTLVVSQSLMPQYYAFRWTTLLLSQEFSLPDTQRLWDALLGHTVRFDFLVYIQLSMLQCIRPSLMSGDFASNMKLLQDYPESVDVATILIKADQIFSELSSSNSLA